MLQVLPLYCLQKKENQKAVVVPQPGLLIGFPFFLRILSLTSNPGYKNTTHVGNMCQLSSKKVPKNVGRLLCRLSIVAILRSGSVLSGLNTSV